MNVPEVSFDLSKIIARKQKVVRKLVLGVKSKLTAHNVTIVSGEATVIDRNHVQCGEETYECENLLLCTGSETFIPGIPGVNSVPYWTHRDALDSKELPASLAIIGGGGIGMEFASFFNSLGVQVTVVEGGDDTVLGAHVLGNPASEIITLAGMAIELKLTAGEWKKIVFPHPTVGEIFKEAL